MPSNPKTVSRLLVLKASHRLAFKQDFAADKFSMLLWRTSTLLCLAVLVNDYFSNFGWLSTKISELRHRTDKFEYLFPSRWCRAIVISWGVLEAKTKTAGIKFVCASNFINLISKSIVSLKIPKDVVFVCVLDSIEEGAVKVLGAVFLHLLMTKCHPWIESGRFLTVHLQERAMKR